MPAAETGLIPQEIRIARRLARLFRGERTGRLRRWPVETQRRLSERRSDLIGELARLEGQRGASAPRRPIELDLAMDALRREAERGEPVCRSLLAELDAELGRLRGSGDVSGLRGGAGGQLLGRG